MTIQFVEVEPPFEEPASGEFFWLAPYARQPSETKKRFRKQVLAGAVTVLRAVGRLMPDFIAGVLQGAMIAAVCSSPLLVEVAARQRVATEAELAQLRAAWPKIRGFLAIKPFVTVAHSTAERLLEALPELGSVSRVVTCSIVVGATATERKFGEAVVDLLGARSIPPDLAGLGWAQLLTETVVTVPWQNEGCVNCGRKAQLARCSQFMRPLHLTCAVNRKDLTAAPLRLACHASREMPLESIDRAA